MDDVIGVGSCNPEMPTRNKQTPVRTPARPFIPGPKLLAPYQWLGVALKQEAAQLDTKPAALMRTLISDGLDAGTDDLWCLRPPPGERSCGGLPKIFLTSETVGLRARLDKAASAAKKRHMTRWSDAARQLANGVRRANEIDLQRYEGPAGQGLIITASGAFPPAALDLATAYVTDDFGSADLVRALLARALIKRAPKGWDRARGVVRVPLAEGDAY